MGVVESFEWSFSVALCFLAMMPFAPGSCQWKLIWKSPLPSKVSFLLWLAFKGKVLTLDRLMDRGIQLPNQCCMGLAQVELATHLFLHCPVVAMVWGFFLERFNIK